VSSDDGKTWTFTLRDGVKFHDGSPLTSEAVKGSIERTRKIGGGASFIWGPVDLDRDARAAEGRLPAFRAAAARPHRLGRLCRLDLQAPASLDKDNAWFNAGNDAGTGPFKISRYEPGQRAVLDRVAGYWGKVPEGAFQDRLLRDHRGHDAGPEHDRKRPGRLDLLACLTRTSRR
jgi:peptide/nickel transport system substrate-binding protein